MIIAQICADIPRSQLNAEQSYSRVERLISLLAKTKTHPLRWWGAMTNPREKLLPFDDREQFLGRIKNAITHPNEGVTITVSTNNDLKTHGKPGTLRIEFVPEAGAVRIEIEKPDAAFGIEATQICRELFATLIAIEPVSFAYMDVMAKTADRDFPKNYRIDFATFPHRKCIGWMGFVPAEVTAEQLPMAASVEPIRGKGTLIVSVAETFDLNNPEHIKHANQVEIALVDLDLLPVTDSSLL